TSDGFDKGLYGSVAAAPDGTLFWSMDHQNRVVRIGPDGKGDCYAGTGEAGFSGDGGSAIRARFDDVEALSYAPEERELYVADAGNLRVRKIDAAGTVTTVVDTAGLSGGQSI